MPLTKVRVGFLTPDPYGKKRDRRTKEDASKLALCNRKLGVVKEGRRTKSGFEHLPFVLFNLRMLKKRTQAARNSNQKKASSTKKGETTNRGRSSPKQEEQEEQKESVKEKIHTHACKLHTCVCAAA